MEFRRLHIGHILKNRMRIFAGGQDGELAGRGNGVNGCSEV